MPLKILAWIHILIAGGFLLIGAAFTAYVAVTGDKDGLVVAHALGAPIVFFAVVIFIPEFLGGIGLLARRAWARIIIIVISTVLVPMIPLGSILGGYGLWVLLRREGRTAFGKS